MPKLNLTMFVLVSVTLLSAAKCGSQHLERSFFNGPVTDRVGRLRQFSLPDQYKIFRYGNDHIEPPAMELALPIAERGESAVRFLTDQLTTSADDLTVRDILLIFERMDAIGSYKVHADPQLMKLLSLRISKMKDEDWRKNCLKMLNRIIAPEQSRSAH